jgi:hypothetical protein
MIATQTVCAVVVCALVCQALLVTTAPNSVVLETAMVRVCARTVDASATQASMVLPAKSAASAHISTISHAVATVYVPMAAATATLVSPRATVPVWPSVCMIAQTAVFASMANATARMAGLVPTAPSLKSPRSALTSVLAVVNATVAVASASVDTLERTVVRPLSAHALPMERFVVVQEAATLVSANVTMDSLDTLVLSVKNAQVHQYAPSTVCASRASASATQVSLALHAKKSAVARTAVTTVVCASMASAAVCLVHSVLLVRMVSVPRHSATLPTALT